MVYSSIGNGEWLDDGSRDKIERGGVFVLTDNQLLADIPCKRYSGEHFIHDLPEHEEEPFRYIR